MVEIVHIFSIPKNTGPTRSCKVDRMSHRVPGLFITGTDTGVGKTYVGAWIARELAAAGHKVGVYKPAASGCRREGEQLVADDAVALWEARAGRANCTGSARNDSKRPSLRTWRPPPKAGIWTPTCFVADWIIGGCVPTWFWSRGPAA